MTTNSASRQRVIAVSAVVIVLLLAVNAYLLYSRIKQDKVIENQKIELTEADRLKIELEKQYHQALSDMEELRGRSDDQDALILQQKEELKEQRAKIDKIIKGGKELKRAREEIKSMVAQNEQYLAEIQELEDENKALKGERKKLVEKSEILEEDLNNQKFVNQTLEGEKENLSREKSQLSSERDRLAKKVNVASVIQVDQVQVTPYRIRNNGKAVKKKAAKDINRLTVCFATSANHVVNAGLEKFYLRVINPIGETLAVEELGSGIIIDKKTGDEVRYTQVKEYDYANDETQLCLNWEPQTGFQRGNYKVEVYNKGHLCGEGSFLLK